MKKLLLLLSCWLKKRLGFILTGLVVLLLFLWQFGSLNSFLTALYRLYIFLLMIVGLIALAMIIWTLVGYVCKKLLQPSRSEIPKTAPPVRRSRVHLPPSIYKRPDPMIYSQYFLTNQGLAVTWDNPDVSIFIQGKIVKAYEDLSPATQYSIRAQVWNNSTDCPAIGVVVQFFYLSFGIGTTRNYIGTKAVDLPVKGVSTLPVLAEMDWVTPTVAGHYCLQIELIWPDDANPANNLGQHNVNIKKLNSPRAEFVFPVRNDATRFRRLRLEANVYAIPPLPECPPTEGPIRLEKNRTVRKMQTVNKYRQHAPVNFSIPRSWQVNFSRSVLELAANETIKLTVEVLAEEGFTDLRPINVQAFDVETGRLAGGVTLYVHH